MPASSPADARSTEILTSIGQDFMVQMPDLTSGDFQIPSRVGNPLYDAVQRADIAELTQGVVDGTGAFDKVMSSVKAHLEDQFQKGRITGDQYVKAYIEMTGMAMNTGLNLVLTAETNYWQALAVQSAARKAEIDAVTAAVALETAKAQLATAHQQAELAKAQYVLTVMQIASEDAKYELTHAQIDLVAEQEEAARAQTLETRSDGSPVAGMTGKQKELYTQQIDSYRKDAVYKVGKMYLDGWIAQKTMDEGLTAPSQLTNAEIDEVLLSMRGTHNMGS